MTGCAGFVAPYVVDQLALVFPDARIVRAVRRPPAPEDGFALDLAEDAATDAMIRTVQPEIVVHLAARSAPRGAAETPSSAWRSNRDAAYRLARAVARHAPRATVLFASSAEVYGRSLLNGPAGEATPTRPVGPYACSKRAAETTLAMHLSETNRLIIARPFNHTGPGQRETFVVPAFAAQLARIEAGLADPLIRVGNLTPARDFLDVRDVAECYARCVERAAALPRHAVVNVARGRTVTIRHVLDTLIGLSGLHVTIEQDPARTRAAEVPVATAETRILERIMAWPPARPLEETLAAVLQDKRDALEAGRDGTDGYATVRGHGG